MAKLKLGFDIDQSTTPTATAASRADRRGGLAPNAALTNLFVFRQTISAAYATYERPFGDLTVLAGLRVEDVRMDLDQVTLGQHDENDYLRAYPSLHLAWKLSDARRSPPATATGSSGRTRRTSTPSASCSTR